MAKFKAYNGAQPGAAGPVVVTTGTAIKTMLQIATPAGAGLRILEWGISFSGSAAATPGTVELVETSGAATVTAHVAAGVFPIQDLTPRVSIMTLGTTATGYTASGEGTPGTCRLLDGQLIAPTDRHVFTFASDMQPEVAPSKFLRIRCTFGAAINALCWITWDE